MRRLLLAAFAALSACVTVQPVPGGGVTVTPAVAYADPGTTVRLVANVLLGAPPVTWETSAGTITPGGLLTVPGCTATLPLTVTVTAISGTSRATSTINVADAVTGITVSPNTANVAPNGTVQFSATVRTVCFPAGVTAQIEKPKRQVVAGK